MAKSISLIGGLTLGAVLMYFLDPNRGRRRRSILRDQGIHLAHDAQNALMTGVKDLNNRAMGQLAEMQGNLVVDIPLDDVLVARVRSKMGRFLSHPGAIQVTATDGIVTLNGTILADEAALLIPIVRNVRGVLGVDNNLEIFEHPGNIPALQQGKKVLGDPIELMQNNWAPGIRLLAVMVGGMTALFGWRRKGIFGLASSLAGMGLLARGLSNETPRHIFGLSRTGHGITFEKTLNIQAPVERVFDTLLHFAQNHTRLMPKVRSFKLEKDHQVHWEVTGPFGMPLSGEAKLSQIIPNKLIAWTSLANSQIRNSGTLHFEPNANGGTRIQLTMTYNPPFGLITHFIATLFGVDPKHQLDEAMVQMKALIEEDNKQKRTKGIQINL